MCAIQAQLMCAIQAQLMCAIQAQLMCAIQAQQVLKPADVQSLAVDVQSLAGAWSELDAVIEPAAPSWPTPSDPQTATATRGPAAVRDVIRFATKSFRPVI
jgi:hypothetical protein